MMRSHSLVVLLSCVFLFLCLDSIPSRGQTSSPQKLTLVQSAVCEDVKDGSPQDVAIAFPVSVGKVACFTAFDPVPRKTVIYHNWFRKDELNTKIRLVLQPRAGRLTAPSSFVKLTRGHGALKSLIRKDKCSVF
jgi:hypothetical protein